MRLSTSALQHTQALCRGDQELINYWLNKNALASLGFCIPVIIIGSGAYGYAIGIWHGIEMASYVAIKLPLLILSTLLINGAINGMLAMVLGSGIGLRNSVQFLLMGFSLMSLILFSLTPIALYIVLQAPSPSSDQADSWHSISMLLHTAVIGYSGILSHRALLRQVQEFAITKRQGAYAFIAWLAGNLFVGAQLSWVMRPFFGTPGSNIEFLRDDPMSGSFYEALWSAMHHFL